MPELLPIGLNPSPENRALAQREQQAQRRQHHRREDDAERGPCLLPARRQSRKLLLNDLNIGFDRGEIGPRLICAYEERRG